MYISNKFSIPYRNNKHKIHVCKHIMRYFCFPLNAPSKLSFFTSNAQKVRRGFRCLFSHKFEAPKRSSYSSYFVWVIIICLSFFVHIIYVKVIKIQTETFQLTLLCLAHQRNATYSAAHFIFFCISQNHKTQF